MNIVYVVEDFSENGGVERIVAQKANTLASQYNHKVSIISVYSDNRPMLYCIDKSVEIIKLEVPFAKKGKWRVSTFVSRVSTLVIAAKRLNKTVKRLRPDIVFFTTTLGALLLPLCRTKAKRVYESHLARPFNPFQKLFGFMERQADAVVCLTKGDATHFRNAKRVMVIPNFIELPHNYVQNYSIKRCIAVGRLEYQKGFDVLIDCWQTIVRKFPDWHLDIYGTGSQYGYLQLKINSLGLDNYITLCGRSDNIMDVYPQYSLHIMLSRFEGQGIALVEAQACGLPSVVTDYIYGASDIVTNRFNGILVRQGDKEAMIKAILEMMDSEKLRQEYGNNARIAAQKYAKDNIICKWVELISSLQSTNAPSCTTP